MKRFLFFVVLMFSVGFCFAEKMEFLSDDCKDLGVIEIASESDVHIVSFMNVSAVQSTNIHQLQKVVIMRFSDYSTARLIYDEFTKNVHGYYDFHRVNNYVRELPVVKAAKSSQFVDNGVLYDVKTLEQ